MAGGDTVGRRSYCAELSRWTHIYFVLVLLYVMALVEWLRPIDRKVQTAIDQLASDLGLLRRFAGKELLTLEQTSGPIGLRPWLWRRGFLSRAATVYDFDAEPMEEYLTDVGYFKLQQLNGEAACVTHDKLLFHSCLRGDFDEHLPTVFGEIADGTPFDREGNRLDRSATDWLTVLLEENDRIVCKPVSSLNGRGVLVVSKTDGEVRANDETTSVEDVTERVASGRYLVMEYVSQAPVLADIYDGATNTVRALTLWDAEADQPFLGNAVLRIGTDPSAPVDTWSRGGLSAPIDFDERTLGRATKQPTNGTMEWFRNHPETGARIEGVTLPHLAELRSVILAMARRLRSIPLIAWDIVLTDDGVVVLEAGSRPNVTMMQVHEPLLSDLKTRSFFERRGVV